MASGEIVQATANDHTDLCTTLKGSGNTLGIVTLFDMPTFKQGRF